MKEKNVHKRNRSKRYWGIKELSNRKKKKFWRWVRNKPTHPKKSRPRENKDLEDSSFWPSWNEDGTSIPSSFLKEVLKNFFQSHHHSPRRALKMGNETCAPSLTCKHGSPTFCPRQLKSHLSDSLTSLGFLSSLCFKIPGNSQFRGYNKIKRSCR